MESHRDVLPALNSSVPLRDKLVQTHQFLQAQFPFIARIAVALYDQQSDLLKTYLHSSGEDDPLSQYTANLNDVPTLSLLMQQKLPRVINNLATVPGGQHEQESLTHEHTRRIGRQGYAASYTMPIFNDDNFVGFLFFDSYQGDVFTEAVLSQLDLFGHLIALMVINELATMRTLVAAVATSAQFTHVRDRETGSHIDRMSRFARLIARELVPRHHLDDDYIQKVFMYAPLHDLGKIAIPDRILLKPGKLDADELAIMRSHARKGREIIDEMLARFSLEGLRHVNILRNIAEFHHEAMNGKGYPAGLQHEEIPLEARIVAVADVFDALTSRRPYKEAWSNQEAFAMLERMAGEQLDAECVVALTRQRAEVEDIQARFAEEQTGFS